VAEMRGLSQATDDAYMRKIADALETDTYQELAPSLVTDYPKQASVEESRRTRWTKDTHAIMRGL